MPRKPRRPRVALFVESSISFGRGVLRGIARYLRVHGPWSIFLEQRELGAALPAWIGRWEGDGIVTRSEDPRILRAGVPVVGLYDRVPGAPGVPMIVNDNRAVGRLAAGHLRDRGFRRLAYYGPRGERWSDERREGAGAEWTRAPGRGAWEPEQEALRRWLEGLPRPVGLVAANDIHGLRALDACRRAGLAVPEQVAVVGADEDAELCELSDPPLSSVAFNPERVGFEAAALLDRLMRGDRAPRKPMLVPPLGVTARQSTDILAIEDPYVAKALHVIRRHACDGVSVKEILAEVPLSRRSFEHRFRKLLGRTPKEEIQRVRIERAKALLAGTDLKAARVSEQLGFHQPAYFSAVFRRETGTSPAEWRRQSRVKRR
jgi:LacI family transcriptional regulator